MRKQAPSPSSPPTTMPPPDCFANPNTMLRPSPVPDAELLGRKERFENPVAYGGWNAGAGIDAPRSRRSRPGRARHLRSCSRA
jgi:hypothetical protein